jgi:hypothetical protein
MHYLILIIVPFLFMCHISLSGLTGATALRGTALGISRAVSDQVEHAAAANPAT